MQEHNIEELDRAYTRPTLDLYICEKYWNFLTEKMNEDQKNDLKKAKETLEHYEKIYTLMDYTNNMNAICTLLETRIGSNNPSIPQTLYRQSGHNKPENLF